MEGGGEEESAEQRGELVERRTRGKSCSWRTSILHSLKPWNGVRPRPAKVGIMVWRVCCRFFSSIASKRLGARRRGWNERLQRIRQEGVLELVVKSLVVWEDYARSSLSWIPNLQDASGASGTWKLPSLALVTLSEATAAMLHSMSFGGCTGDLATYVQDYVKAFRRGLPTINYSAQDRTHAKATQRTLISQFYTTRHLNKRFQLITKVLGTNFARKKKDVLLANGSNEMMEMKDSFLEVYMRQSKLTFQAILGSQSVFRFRHLSKLHASVEEFADAQKYRQEHERYVQLMEEDALYNAKPSASLRSQVPPEVVAGHQWMWDSGASKPSEAAVAVTAASEAALGRRALPGGKRQTFPGNWKQRVVFTEPADNDSGDEQDWAPPADTFRPGRAASWGHRSKSQAAVALPRGWSTRGRAALPEEEEEDESPQVVLDLRARIQEPLSYHNKNGHDQRVDDLRSLREHIKITSALSPGNKDRFTQLVTVMDQGHNKIEHLAGSTKRSEAMFEGLQEALVEDIRPKVERWVSEGVAMGHIPPSLLERALGERMSKASPQQHKALNVKVQELSRVLEERKTLHQEEEELSQKLASISGQLEDHEASATPPRKSRLMARQSPSQSSSERSSATHRPSRGPGLGHKAVALEAVAKNAGNELKGQWPAGASEAGDLMLSGLEAFTSSVSALQQCFHSAQGPEDAAALDEHGHRCSSAAKLLFENLGTFIDALEIETLPPDMVKEAFQEHLARSARLAVASQDRQKAKPPKAKTTQKSKIKKLEETKAKFARQIDEQRAANVKREINIQQLQKLVEEAGRELEKAQDGVASSAARASAAAVQAAKVTEEAEERAKEEEAKLEEVVIGLEEELTQCSERRDRLRAEVAELENDARQLNLGLRTRRTLMEEMHPECSTTDGTAMDETVGGSSGSTVGTNPAKSQPSAGGLKRSLSKKRVTIDEKHEPEKHEPEIKEQREPGAEHVAELASGGKSRRASGKKARKSRQLPAGREHGPRLDPEPHDLRLDTSGESALREQPQQVSTETAVEMHDPPELPDLLEVPEQVLGLEAEAPEQRRGSEEEQEAHATPVHSRGRRRSSHSQEEPWLDAFPGDPPEVAKQKYELLRYYKVEEKSLSKKKTQKLVAFMMDRRVKQLKRELKLKTRLLLSFCTTDAEREAVVTSFVPEENKQSAFHRVELERLTERSRMLGKLITFWKSRTGAIEDGDDNGRAACRREFERIIGSAERFAQALHAKRARHSVAANFRPGLDPRKGRHTYVHASVVPFGQAPPHLEGRKYRSETEKRATMMRRTLSLTRTKRRRPSNLRALIRRGDRADSEGKEEEEKHREAVAEGTESHGQGAATFLHDVLGELGKVHRALRNAHPGAASAAGAAPEPEDFALSDTLLAPSANGAALFRSYLERIARLPEESRSLVVNHLIGLERERLFRLLKRPLPPHLKVGNALEASQQTVISLDKVAQDGSVYVENKLSRRESHSEASSTSSSDVSPGGSSDASVEDEAIKWDPSGGIRMSLDGNYTWRSLVHRRMTTTLTRRISLPEVVPEVPATSATGAGEEAAPTEEKKAPGFFASVMGASKMVQHRRQLQRRHQNAVAATAQTADAKSPSKWQQKSQNARRFAKLMEKKSKTTALDEAQKAEAAAEGPRRPASAPPRLVTSALTPGQRRRAAEAASLARNARKAFQRRASHVKALDEDHEKEWAAIRLSIRRTKEMQLSITQQRVKKMLVEMSNNDRGDDLAASQVDSHFQAARQLRNLLPRSQNERGSMNSAVTQEVRKKMMESMQKDMDRSRKTFVYLQGALLQRARKARERRQGPGTDAENYAISVGAQSKAAYQAALRKLNEVIFTDQDPKPARQSGSGQPEGSPQKEPAHQKERGSRLKPTSTQEHEGALSQQKPLVSLRTFLQGGGQAERRRNPPLGGLRSAAAQRPAEAPRAIVGMNVQDAADLMAFPEPQDRSQDALRRMLIEQEAEVREQLARERQVPNSDVRLRKWERWRAPEAAPLAPDFSQEMNRDALALIAALDSRHRSSVQRLGHVVKTLKRWRSKPREGGPKRRAVTVRRTALRRQGFSEVGSRVLLPKELPDEGTTGHLTETSVDRSCSSHTSSSCESDIPGRSCESNSPGRDSGKQSSSPDYSQFSSESRCRAGTSDFQESSKEQDPSCPEALAEDSRDMRSTTMGSAILNPEEQSGAHASGFPSAAHGKGAKAGYMAGEPMHYLRSGLRLPAGWARVLPAVAAAAAAAAAPGASVAEPEGFSRSGLAAESGRPRRTLFEHLDGEEFVEVHSAGRSPRSMFPSSPSGSRLRSRSKTPEKEDDKELDDELMREVHMDVLRELVHRRVERDFRRHCRLWKKWLRHDARLPFETSSDGEQAKQLRAGPRAARDGMPHPLEPAHAVESSAESGDELTGGNRELDADQRHAERASPDLVAPEEEEEGNAEQEAAAAPRPRGAGGLEAAAVPRPRGAGGLEAAAAPRPGGAGGLEAEGPALAPTAPPAPRGGAPPPGAGEESHIKEETVEQEDQLEAVGGLQKESHGRFEDAKQEDRPEAEGSLQKEPHAKEEAVEQEEQPEAVGSLQKESHAKDEAVQQEDGPEALGSSQKDLDSSEIVPQEEKEDDSSPPFDLMECGTKLDVTCTTGAEQPDGFSLGLGPLPLAPPRSRGEDGAALPVPARPGALFGMKPFPRFQGMKTSVDQYLKSFEGGDLNTLLEDLSRPGTTSRPGTMGGRHSSRGLAEAAGLHSFAGPNKALDESCSPNHRADKDFGSAWPSSDANTMVSIWPEFAWPGSARACGGAADEASAGAAVAAAVTGGQNPRPVASGASPRNVTSGSPKSAKTSSSLALPALTAPPATHCLSGLSTSDSWRRALTSRESPSWMKGGLEGLTPLLSSITTVAQTPQSNGRRAATAAPLSARAASARGALPPVDRAGARAGAAAPAKGPRWKARPGTVANCQTAARRGLKAQMDARTLA